MAKKSRNKNHSNNFKITCVVMSLISCVVLFCNIYQCNSVNCEIPYSQLFSRQKNVANFTVTQKYYSRKKVGTIL